MTDRLKPFSTDELAALLFSLDFTRIQPGTRFVVGLPVRACSLACSATAAQRSDFRFDSSFERAKTNIDIIICWASIDAFGATVLTTAGVTEVKPGKMQVVAKIKFVNGSVKFAFIDGDKAVMMS
jgi:hypothetical protein